MTEFSLPYGNSHITVNIPAACHVDVLSPDIIQPLSDIGQSIRGAIANPLGIRKLTDFPNTASIGIAINDKTRPVPQPNPLYALLKYLEDIGFSKDTISLFVGSGAHEPMTCDEFSRILTADTINQYRVIVHDCDHSPMADLGISSYGTPIQMNADFLNCDIKISVGNIEPHHFMGFSGGIKTAVIGLASRQMITVNHAGLTHPHAQSGAYHINPLRQDIEEIGRIAGVGFALGSVLDESKSVSMIFFGDPTEVMKAAIPLVRRIFGVKVSKPYDLVIASPGGAPKDINLYQSQKGLTHAARITRDGGWVLLLAECPEGSGSPSYETYVASKDSHQTIIKEFQSGYFKVGPHKALQIAREAIRVNIVLVSDIDPQQVKQWKLTPSNPGLLNPLVEWVLSQLPDDARIAVFPGATRTMTEVNHD